LAAPEQAGLRTAVAGFTGAAGSEQCAEGRWSATGVAMSGAFQSIHNQYEQAVFDAVSKGRTVYPAVADDAELLADVACVALNRLPSRYIRHRADYAFYLTESEAKASDRALATAVKHAFEFVQARVAMRARA